MSDDLQSVLFEKFRRAFGDPHHTEGQDRHWALRSLAYMAAVNVLVNGSEERPVVWLFDPHDPRDGVFTQRIAHESEIDPLIRMIEERIRKAGRPR